jgi:hypothetical protein
MPNFVIEERVMACKNTSKFDKINNTETEFIVLRERTLFYSSVNRRLCSVVSDKFA